MGAALAQTVQRGEVNAGEATQAVAQPSTAAPIQIAQTGGTAAGASTGGAVAGAGPGTTLVVVGAAVATIAIAADSGSTAATHD